MITYIGEHDLLLTSDGFLTPSEVRGDIPVIGIDRQGSYKPVAVTISAHPTAGDSHILYTSQSEIALTGDTQLYLEGHDNRAALLISKLMEDKYGDQIFVSFNTSIPPSCRFLRKRYEWNHEIELTKDTAFVMGAMVRRIPQFRGRLILRIRSVNAKKLSRGLEHHLGNTKSLRKSGIRLIDGETWSWIKLDSPKLLALMESFWPNPYEIPVELRCVEKPLLSRWYEGAKLACSQDEEESSAFTFLEERQLRQMMGYHQTLARDGYVCQPEPKYQPMDISIGLGEIEEATARVISLSTTRERIYRLEVEESYWSPVVNSILLKMA